MKTDSSHFHKCKGEWIFIILIHTRLRIQYKMKEIKTTYFMQNCWIATNLKSTSDTNNFIIIIIDIKKAKILNSL